MVYEPVGRVVVVTEATPVDALTAAEASVAPFATKSTVPVGFAVVTADTTVAVKVALVPGETATALVRLVVSVLTVGARVIAIVCVTPELAA
jgi:hypothetical protein